MCLISSIIEVLSEYLYFQSDLFLLHALKWASLWQCLHFSNCLSLEAVSQLESMLSLQKCRDMEEAKGNKALESCWDIPEIWRLCQFFPHLTFWISLLALIFLIDSDLTVWHRCLSWIWELPLHWELLSFHFGLFRDSQVGLQ